MKYLLFSIFFLGLAQSSISQKKELTYYLPDIQYDTKIPTPEEFLGYQVGEWHVSHDQLYHYMRTIAEKSDRVTLTEYARSHENRPLVYLTITSPENHQKLDQLRSDHVKLTDASLSDEVDINTAPIVIYQGYSIHGNEASGSNASLLNAYYLAAGMGTEVIEKLNNTIILLDPSYNPDGLHRFSTWVNTHKSKNLSGDPNDREYNEAWPGGRTNHYWFDLNRDWLLLTHPESQGRIKVFHEWKPDILTDHHEMGTNSTFFFQPGVPSRTNDNTPQKNQVLTEEIGKFHAEGLDAIGSLYYTKTGFDDYYYGKGSTYPDINGAVGILFEQASSRGHLQQSANGLLEFPFTVRNQVVTSLSTQKAAVNLRAEMLSYKRKFFKDAAEEAKRSSIKGYVVSDSDHSKLHRFLEILATHKISAYKTSNSINIGSNSYEKETSFVIPMDQKQSKLVKTIFEKVTSFKDSIFYDVSAWTMPLAFDLQYDALNNSQMNQAAKGNLFSVSDAPIGGISSVEKTYAYIYRWDDYYAPTVLYQIQKEGLRTKLATSDIVLQTGVRQESFNPGSIVVPIQNQKMSEKEITSFLRGLSQKFPIHFHGLKSGNGVSEQTLGNPSMSNLEMPKIMLLIGPGVSSYDAGELWHQLDTRLQIPIAKVDINDFSSRSLSRYNTIIMPNGSYRFSDSQTKAISDWVSGGGNIIAINRALSWLISKKFINLKKRSSDYKAQDPPSYAKASSNNGAKVLGGAIFNTDADLTHPLLYGYSDSNLATFKRGSTFYEDLKNRYASPLKYTKTPLLSGYLPRGAGELASGAPALTVHSKGGGKIVAFMDNPVFRGYWWGGNKLLANAIFFSDAISRQTTESEE